jgi:hypothetical protein
MIIFYVFLVLLYSIFMIGLIFSDKPPFFVLPLILMHGVFMFSIPYFVMRSSVKNLKYELEREFYYLTKK